MIIELFKWLNEEESTMVLGGEVELMTEVKQINALTLFNEMGKVKVKQIQDEAK